MGGSPGSNISLDPNLLKMNPRGDHQRVLLTSCAGGEFQKPLRFPDENEYNIFQKGFDTSFII